MRIKVKLFKITKKSQVKAQHINSLAADISKCNQYEGEMEQKDVVFYDVGKISCENGCIEVYKAKFGCKPEDNDISESEPSAEHLEIARARCEGKTQCDMYSCPAQFRINKTETETKDGDRDCDDGDHVLWIVYG